MKIFFICVDAQKKFVGPPNNVGREYGNPKMPFVVSHLAGANKKRLERGNAKGNHSSSAEYCAFADCVEFNRDIRHRFAQSVLRNSERRSHGMQSEVNTKTSRQTQLTSASQLCESLYL
jgi:hypothetical protein